MCKDRTKQQDFDLIKGLIDSDETLNLTKVLKDENINFRYFFKKYKAFFFSNYMAEEREKAVIKKVIQRIIKKGLYCDKITTKYSFHSKIDSSFNFSSERFKKETITRALNLFANLEKTRNQIVYTLNEHAIADTTYSNDFIDFCNKYNLKNGLERANLRRSRTFFKPRKIIKKPLEQIQKEKRELLVPVRKRIIIFKNTQLKKDIEFLKAVSKSHYNKRNYTQENMNALRLLDCLTANEYDKQKAINKIEELEILIKTL